MRKLTLLFFLLAACLIFARGGGGCFLEGTEIALENGTAPIETLTVGQDVLAFADGQVVQSTVSEIFQVQRDYYYDIVTAHGSVNVTAEHPFYVGNDRFVEAQELKAGDAIYVRDGDSFAPAAILSISRVNVPVTAYNLRVDGEHTFFANGFAVHNKGGCFPGNTLVSCPDGQTSISDLAPGDEILSLYHGSVVPSTVRSTYSLHVSEYYSIGTEGGSINVTAEHPFYTGGGYVVAQDLHAGDYIYALRDGAIVREKVLAKALVQEPATVYNLHVDRPRTFFANDYAVHNKGGGCFLAGTAIATPAGSMPVESVSPGDLVSAFNSDGRVVSAAVAEVYGVQRDYYYYIVTAYGSVNVTAEHPFYVGNNHFVEAQELKAGDSIYVRDGVSLTPATVLSITRVNQPVTAYNLRVDGQHTFFANGFAVHNKGGGGFGAGGGTGSTQGDTVCLVTFALIYIFFWLCSKRRSGGGSSGEWSSTASVPKDKVYAKAKKISVLLSMWGKADPAWDEKKVKDDAQKTFLKLQQCWQARDYTEMKDLMMPDLWNQHVAQLDAMKARHEINKLDGLQLLDSQLVLVNNYHDKQKDQFTIWFKAAAKDTMVDDRTGNKIRGDTGTGTFEEFWTFQRAGDSWKLKRIDQPEEGMGVVTKENFDSLFTPAALARFYEKAGGPEIKKLGVSATREQAEGAVTESMSAIKQRAGKVHNLLNFLAQQNKLWDEETMETMVRSLFISFNVAVEKKDFDAVKDALAPDLYGRCMQMAADMQSRKQHIEKRNLAVRDVEVVLVKNYYDNRKDEFTAWVSGQAQTVLVDDKTGKIASGDNYVADFEDYWTFRRDSDAWKLAAIDKGFKYDENVDEGSSKEMMEWYQSQERAV